MNLMEEEQTVEANPRKKRRVETDTSDDIKPSKSEQTLAPPASIKPPTADAPTTPIAKVKAKKAQTPKKIKTYTFSVGASDCLSATPSDSKRGPLGSPFRSSPLRTVSTNSTSSLETVDSGLRSVSGLSSTGSLTSNISSDLNFSFPTYNVNTPLPPAHSMDLPTVILTPPAPITNLPPTMQQQFQPRPQNQQTLYTFGLPGNSQFTFNPNLPHTVQPAPNYHLAISNSSYSTFPQQMVGPLSQFGVATPGLKGLQQRQQEYMPYQTSSGLRFSDGFGTTTTMIAMKRSIGEVGGVLVDERAWKVPRFEEV
ncbi:hypothetical protein QFC24_001527 [Naganishia onofrii]|uniref:Uncharacterized protein n=1 Tax=Naganishia onofrii TaxID=1851511 RepID=A0ACC2XVA7_9TREE|nr:hypothetical protein QFC24_001527 [Naganishia onofrii]